MPRLQETLGLQVGTLLANAVGQVDPVLAVPQAREGEEKGKRDTMIQDNGV